MRMKKDWKRMIIIRWSIITQSLPIMMTSVQISLLITPCLNLRTDWLDKEVREAAETTISHETEGAHTQKPETVKPMTREPEKEGCYNSFDGDLGRGNWKINK
ncbi:uncharacterized protein C1orf54 homolog isoform X4 [Mustela lutreola]|uniref:uncharacterized protein C1orf54 homolog isoform X4 n=1 Tax=Mustela lutreola TaxID=9666 RepID=UPI0027978D31|nr:uncharacterized protein C1orf54 homolog isoform X4 [Mustela lutreola]